MHHQPGNRAARNGLRLAVAAFAASLAACASSGTTGGYGAGGSGAAAGSTGSAGTGAAGATGTGGRRAAAGGTGGAAAGTAGAGGAAAGAAGAGGAATAACAYKLCEGFETGTVGGLPQGWTMLNGYGASAARGVGLANDQARSGTMALKSDSAVTGEARVQKSLASLGATATKHWGRIYYKMASPIVKPASGVIHITFVALEGTTEDRVVDTVENTDGAHQWIYNVPDDSCCNGSAYDWMFDDAWHCAEWYVDESMNAYRFFSDSTEVTQIGFTGNAGAKMSPWTSLAVGNIFYQTPPSAIVMWFDDLAIDDNRIGCQ